MFQHTIFKSLGVVLLGALLASISQAGETTVEIPDGVSILENWAKDQHVYKVGDLGVRPELLDGLEKWLDENAPNWTVLFLESAAGETYTNVFGETTRGIDAVEDAMEKGLPARTAFSEFKDPDSGRPTGAFFILSLKDRTMSYYGSESYQLFLLGAKQWKGRLDSRAVTAMKDGGRLVDAARETIESIDERYHMAKKASQERVAQNLIDAREGTEQVGEMMKKAGRELDALRDNLAPDANGPLALSPLEEWQVDFERLKGYQSKGFTSLQLGGITLLGKKVNEWREKISEFRADRNKLGQLEKEVESLAAAEVPDSIRTALNRARAQYRNGEPAYRNSMRDVNVLISDFHASRERQEARQEMVVAGGATGAGCLALMGVVGNRRRRRVKKQAEDLLEKRRAEMKEMSDRLFVTMDRAAVVVGPAEELTERGYTGETLALSKQALQKIDEAFVLSSNVQQIVTKAEALIGPGNPLSKSRNLVSGGRYEEAVDLLDAEMRVESRAVADLQERARPGEDCGEVFGLPFDEWAGQTGDALDEAETCLDEVDRAWTTIVSRRENLEAAIFRLAERRPEPTDGWFECDVTFESWLPEMRGAFERGAELGRTDPVGALQGAVGEGDRMVAEAGELLDLVERFRKEKWSGLEAGEKVLHEHRRGTVWIDETLEKRSANCDEIAERGVSESVADLLLNFARDLDTLFERIATGAELVERADDIAAPAIKNGESLVTQSRRELADALELKSEDLLVEKNANPSDYLAEAGHQLEGALAALDLGEIAPARGFLDEVDALVTKVKLLVEESRQSLADYPAMSEALWGQRGELEETLGKTGKSVEKMRLRYAPRALFVNPENISAGSYAESPSRVSEVLGEIVRKLDGAKSAREKGALLESRAFLESGRALATGGEELCREVRARKDELAALEKSNAEQMGGREREEDDLSKMIEDRRVTRTTLVNFKELGQRLKEARNAVGADGGRNDPFFSEILLEELAVRIPALRSAIADDLSQHGDAERLFGTVNLALREARELYRTAESDRIPDSSKTTQTYREVEGLEHDLDEARVVLETDHADWRTLQTRLRKLHLGLSEATVAFRRELKLAREAVRYLQAGAGEVDRAEGWSGAYGVRINGRPGGRALDQANVVMMQGNYQSAMEWAGRALADARSAVASAEAQQSALAHAEQRKREQRERSARSSRMTQSMMSSSLSSSGPRSSPSRGTTRSSSVGRSSFRSGSGVGRSGW